MPMVTKQRNPNALTATRRQALEIGKFRVRVGWAEDMGADPETVMIAAINMLGAPAANIPARDVLTPFIRNSFALIRRKQRSAVLAVNKGKDPEPILRELADELREGLKRALLEYNAEPNAPSTIAKKGFNDPLVGAGAGGGRLVEEANAQVTKR